MNVNIVLFCSAGLSTSLLVNKMKSCAKEMNFECTIHAYSINNISKYAASADIIILGPQIKFDYDRVKAMIPDKPVVLLDARVYGTFNGKAVLDIVRKELDLGGY